MKINISEKECNNLHSLIFNFFYKYILTLLRNNDKIIIREMKKNNQVSGKDEQKWNIRFQN